MEAFNEYVVKAKFVDPKSRVRFDTYLLDRTAGDVAEDFSPDFALTPGANALFKCPVPGCMRDSDPSALVSDFYAHLEDAVY